MAYKTVDVEIDLEDFSNQELIDELESRGVFIPKLQGTEKILTVVDLQKWKEFAEGR